MFLRARRRPPEPLLGGLAFEAQAPGTPHRALVPTLLSQQRVAPHGKTERPAGGTGPWARVAPLS